MSLTIGHKHNPIKFNLLNVFHQDPLQVHLIALECMMNFHLLFIQRKLNNDIEVFFSVIPLLTSTVL